MQHHGRRLKVVRRLRIHANGMVDIDCRLQNLEHTRVGGLGKVLSHLGYLEKEARVQRLARHVREFAINIVLVVAYQQVLIDMLQGHEQCGVSTLERTTSGQSHCSHDDAYMRCHHGRQEGRLCRRSVGCVIISGTDDVLRERLFLGEYQLQHLGLSAGGIRCSSRTSYQQEEPKVRHLRAWRTTHQCTLHATRDDSRLWLRAAARVSSLSSRSHSARS